MDIANTTKPQEIEEVYKNRKIKFFKGKDFEVLEKEINEFLGKNKIVELQYSAGGLNHNYWISVLIIYT
jgi:hypothetical protein